MLAQEKVLVHDYPQEPKPDDSKAITLVETKKLKIEITFNFVLGLFLFLFLLVDSTF